MRYRTGIFARGIMTAGKKKKGRSDEISYRGKETTVKMNPMTVSNFTLGSSLWRKLFPVDR